MFVNQIREQLVRLKLTGMLTALDEQLNMPDIQALSFEERFGLLIDREMIDRENRRLKRRLKQARLKQSAAIEDIDFRNKRGVTKGEILSLASCEWIRKQQNIIITGPTGIGKTYLACALAQKACREGFSSVYYGVTRLLRELHIAQGDGTYASVLSKLAKIDVLVLDDWGLSVLTELQRKNLLEIFEDRYAQSSTILTTQFPVDRWHEIIGNPTIADAILDRIIHNSHKIFMKGESMRKQNQVSKLPT